MRNVAQPHAHVLGPLEDTSLPSYFRPFDGRVTLLNASNVEPEKLVCPLPSLEELEKWPDEPTGGGFLQGPWTSEIVELVVLVGCCHRLVNGAPEFVYCEVFFRVDTRDAPRNASDRYRSDVWLDFGIPQLKLAPGVGYCDIARISKSNVRITRAPFIRCHGRSVK